MFAGTTTSSPGPTPTARRASSSASVPLATPSGVVAAAVTGPGRLEGGHVGPVDEGAGVDDPAHALRNFVIDLRVLGRQVDEGDRWRGLDGGHACSSCGES